MLLVCLVGCWSFVLSCSPSHTHPPSAQISEWRSDAHWLCVDRWCVLCVWVFLQAAQSPFIEEILLQQECIAAARCVPFPSPSPRLHQRGSVPVKFSKHSSQRQESDTLSCLIIVCLLENGYPPLACFWSPYVNISTCR